jgi:hypothetical protein
MHGKENYYEINPWKLNIATIEQGKISGKKKQTPANPPVFAENLSNLVKTSRFSKIRTSRFRQFSAKTGSFLNPDIEY